MVLCHPASGHPSQLASSRGQVRPIGVAHVVSPTHASHRSSAATPTAALLPLLIPSLGAQAATIDVAPGNDELSGVTVDGNCSLQEAITAARPDCEVVSRICTSEK